MSHIEIITPARVPDRDDLDPSDIGEMLVLLTMELARRGADVAHGALGGEFGYGAHFENDVFLMRPYCWCERDDCPWCAGCGDAHEAEPHTEACYQARLDALRRKHGAKIGRVWTAPFGNDPGAKAYEEAKRALVSEMGLSWFGNEVHCTCESESRLRAAIAACQCDWHLGRGPFRFGPAADAPNFWHKPSGLRVRWYKWIGRDMEPESAPDCASILRECVGSLPNRVTPEPRP